MQRFSLGIDIGGTFTDIVVFDARSGRQVSHKELTTHDDPALIFPQALRLVRQLDQGGGVLVLTDVYGATPGNIAARLLTSEHVEGVAGVNLPMLVRALTYRNEPLDVVIAKAISGG